MAEYLIIALLCVTTFLAIFNPLMGLLGFFVIAYIRPQDYYAFLAGAEPARWILIITLVSFIFQRLQSKEKLVKAKQIWGILAILLCILISKINAIDTGMWMNATKDFIEVGLIFFLLINILTTQRKLRYFYLFFILINLMVVLRFLYAYKTGTAGMQGGKPGDTSLGFLANADNLGIGMAIALAYVTPAIFSAKGFFLKGLAALASAGFMLAIMATESRGARLGMMIVLAVSLMLQFKPQKLKLKHYSIGIIIALLLIGGFAYKYRWAFIESFESSLNTDDSGRIGRESTWGAAKRMIGEHPVIGVGRGNYLPYWKENYPPGVYKYELAHNIIYEVTAETGIFGMLAYLFFSLIGLWDLAWLRKKYKNTLENNYFLDMLFAVYLTGVAAFYVNGMFITVAFYWHIYILVALFVCARNILIKEQSAINAPAKEKIKLMHVSLTLGTAGMEKLVLALAKGTNKNNFNSSVCCLTHEASLSQEFPKNNIPVFYCHKKEGFDYKLPFKLAKLFKKEKIDLLHTHDSTANLYALLGAKLAGIKTVINTEHGGIFFESWRLKWINRFLAKMNFKMICVSEKVKNDLLKMKINKDKLIVIHNGIDLNEFNITVNRTAKRRDLASLANNDFVLCSIGRLRKLKNQKMLLDAARQIFQSIAGAKLLIVGDGPMKEELQGYAQKLGIAEKVFFLQKRQDIPEILKVSDCFLHCSDYESFGIVLLEAMMAEVPVIATDVGGIHEIIEHEITGILIPKNDVEALVNTVIKVRNGPEYFKTITTRAKDNVIKNFNIEKTIQAYEAVYLTACGKEVDHAAV